jgi:hypothetical protein
VVQERTDLAAVLAGSHSLNSQSLKHSSYADRGISTARARQNYVLLARIIGYATIITRLDRNSPGRRIAPCWTSDPAVPQIWLSCYAHDSCLLLLICQQVARHVLEPRRSSLGRKRVKRRSLRHTTIHPSSISAESPV